MDDEKEGALRVQPVSKDDPAPGKDDPKANQDKKMPMDKKAEAENELVRPSLLSKEQTPRVCVCVCVRACVRAWVGGCEFMVALWS
jgi:hypothetical protein